MRAKNWIRKGAIALFTGLLFLTLAFVMDKPGQTVQAADAATSGIIGGVQWEYGEESHTLMLSAATANNGAIPDFDSLEARPWNAFKDEIWTVKVWFPAGKGVVTSIGKSAFEGMSRLANVEILGGVAEVRSRAFKDCESLYNAYLPALAKGHVAKDAFDGRVTIQYYCTHPEDKQVWKEIVNQPATLDENGSYSKELSCSICGDWLSDYENTIYSPSKIYLSNTSYTYSGKAVTPSVTVKNWIGQMKKDTDYTVSYASGRKNVGTYTVTVKGKFKYQYTKNLTFTINPKGTEISKLTAGKKAFTVAVKKQATQTTGYEISYSTDKNFKKTATKSAKITSSKTVSKKISGLKKGKKYYVKIRTYKTVKSKKYYSAWSKVKTVKAK